MARPRSNQEPMTTPARIIANIEAAPPAAAPEIRADIRNHDWDWQASIQEHVEALDAVMRFCAASLGVATEKPWLTLCGGSGRGKTHLAFKFAEWCRTVSPGRYYWRWIDVLAITRNFDDKPAQRHFWKRMDDCRPVAIDDLGSGHDTEYAAAIACEIAERRVGLATLWTSNMNRQQIAAKVDARIASRMKRNGGEVFKFEKARDFDA